MQKRKITHFHFSSFLIGAILALLLSAGVGYLFLHRYAGETFADVRAWSKTVFRIERSVIESLPIFPDYVSPEKMDNLRTHLLDDHLREAERSGMTPIASDEAIRTLLSQKKLVELPSGSGVPYYFYNVPIKYRVLTPHTARGLNIVAKHFQAILKRRGVLAPVKIAVSSVTRPESYQKNLRRKNGNASLESSHSYGISFDLFFEDYFVDLPGSSSESGLSQRLVAFLRPGTGFLLGDALSRQFQSALMQTMLDLQKEGLLYAILEKNQRVYHVTILASAPVDHFDAEQKEPDGL